MRKKEELGYIKHKAILDSLMFYPEAKQVTSLEEQTELRQILMLNLEYFQQ